MNDCKHGYYAILKNTFDIFSAPFSTREEAEQSRQKSIIDGSEFERSLSIIYVRKNPPEGLPTNSKENE